MDLFIDWEDSFGCNAREVTRSMEGSDERGVDGDFFVEGWEVRKYCMDLIQGTVDHVQILKSTA